MAADTLTRAYRRALTLLTVLLAMATVAMADGLPSPQNPPRLVNDFAGLMGQSEAAALEDSLTRFARHTSTQVTVVTVTGLDGYDIAQYAQELAEKWGVGQEGKDNGVIILIKPKTSDSQGRAFIGTGYGAEGALPDVTCSRIVRETMIPHFMNNDYPGGITAGAVAVMKAMSGEFEADEEDDAGIPVIAIIILIGVVLFILAFSDNSQGNGRNSRHITRSSGDEWIAASILSSMARGGGSGGGGWSGGGFGGFGGGSFGGGGGGGSW